MATREVKCDGWWGRPPYNGVGCHPVGPSGNLVTSLGCQKGDPCYKVETYDPATNPLTQITDTTKLVVIGIIVVVVFVAAWKIGVFNAIKLKAK